MKILILPAINPPILELTLYRGYQCTRCSYLLRSQGKEAKIAIGKHSNRTPPCAPEARAASKDSRCNRQ
jgi:hypothetical protein